MSYFKLLHYLNLRHRVETRVTRNSSVGQCEATSLGAKVTGNREVTSQKHSQFSPICKRKLILVVSWQKVTTLWLEIKKDLRKKPTPGTSCIPYPYTECVSVDTLSLPGTPVDLSCSHAFNSSRPRALSFSFLPFLTDCPRSPRCLAHLMHTLHLPTLALTPDDD